MDPRIVVGAGVVIKFPSRNTQTLPETSWGKITKVGRESLSS